jgi:hypothetical protein
MKYLVILFCFTAAFVQAAVSALTNEMSFTSGTLRGIYQWRVSEQRLLATPEWTPEAQAIPLAPDKACRLGAEWLAKHNLAQFELQSIQVFRYPSPYAGDPGVQLRKRYYYRLEYHSKRVEMMYVYVLLDGTVLEPSLTPSKEKAK